MKKMAEDLLAPEISIHSPRMLFQVADSIIEFIDSGLLREIPGTFSVRDINPNRGLPDYINILFETIPGGTQYRLTCETYHGGRGEFRRLGYPVISNDGRLINKGDARLWLAKKTKIKEILQIGSLLVV